MFNRAETIGEQEARGQLVQIDRALAQYGVEAKEIHRALREYFRVTIHGWVAILAVMPAHGPFPGLDAVSWPRTQNQVKLKSNSIFHPSEVKMSHASMLKARRQHQKTRKLLDVEAKQAKRLAKQALAGPVVKKEKVKKVRVKKEKVATEKVKKVKLTKEELGRQDSKKSSAGTGKKGAS